MKLPHPRGQIKIPSRSDWILKAINVFIATIGMDIAGNQVYFKEHIFPFRFDLSYILANLLFLFFFCLSMFGIMDIYRIGKFVCDGVLLNRNNGEGESEDETWLAEK